MRLYAVVAALVLSGYLRGQSQAPFVFTRVDVKLWEESQALDRLFEERALVYHDAALEKHLAALAAPMLPSAPLERVAWNFHVLRDPMVNAFALPNGSIYVNTGLLARAENDDQVAGVLAHEIAHAANRHTYVFNRSLRKKIVASEIIAVVAAWIPAGSWGAAVSVGAGMGQFAILDMVYGYSRQLEEDADRAAIDRAKSADRDPRQLVRIFQLLDEKLEPEPVPRFFWDHPRLKDRIAYLQQALHLAAMPPPEDNPDYLERVRPAVLQNIQLDLDSRRFRSAVAAGKRLAAAFPKDAAVLYWLGESCRLLGPRQMKLKPEEATDAGLRKGYRQQKGRTEQEDTERLAATPEGRAALAANQRQAEDWFLRAAAADPTFAEPYAGLGALYRQQDKPAAAAGAWRKYVAIARTPAAQERGRRALADAEAKSK